MINDVPIAKEEDMAKAKPMYLSSTILIWGRYVWKEYASVGQVNKRHQKSITQRGVAGTSSKQVSRFCSRWIAILRTNAPAPEAGEKLQVEVFAEARAKCYDSTLFGLQSMCGSSSMYTDFEISPNLAKNCQYSSKIQQNPARKSTTYSSFSPFLLASALSALLSFCKRLLE
jgi:hypothetical protein